MNTQYRYINFVKTADKPKTTVWSCRTRHGDALGEIKWFGAWRQYCFFPTYGLSMVFSAGCLADIQDFIGRLANNSLNPTPEGAG
jgi:hypothetical protein